MASGEWTFEAKDNGTLLPFSGGGEIGKFFKMAEDLVVKQVNKQVRTDLDGLKLLMEAG